MSVLLLFIGILAGALAGAAGAIFLARTNREQLRDAMKSISSDVLAQTGDSLAQRLADQRRIDEERTTGEMTARAQELKQLVGPVHEKLTKVESELGRLERERRDSQVQLSEMVRALSAGTDTLRRETGELVSALKRPETRGSWASFSCAGSSSWPAWWPTATSSSSTRSTPPTVACGRTCWFACPAGS